MKSSRVLVSLALTLIFTAAAGLAKTESHVFSLAGQSGDRQEFAFKAQAAGTIRVEARWTGSPSKLTLVLNGPGQTGYYQRLEDGSPLVVVQDVTDDILNKGTDWKVSIVNFGRSVPVKGTMTISYPEEFQPRRYDRFDKVTISDVEKVSADRAVITVEYEIERPHSQEVFLGAAVLNDGADLSTFGFRPASVEAGRGRAQVEVVYSGKSSPGRTTSDQIAVYLYEGNRTPFCRATHDLGLVWYK